ncbi:MAG: hypothetical protein AAGN46_16155 [Acidobacteriota bacterium]
MILGINRVFRHGDRELHLQAEDLGTVHGAFEIRVYEGGTVLWQKRLPYAADIPGDDAAKGERQQALRAQMESTLRTVEAGIAQGRIGG